MNEVRLIYFGSVTDISGNLLFLLNVVEVRPATELQQGYFICEKKFGQESIRSLSLDLCDPSAKDVLIYRYLSEREKQALKDLSQPRRFFVLLHNFFNLDYIAGEIQSEEASRFNFLVDMSADNFFKPFAYASRQLPSKNFYRVIKVKSPEKREEKTGGQWHLPMLLLVLLKILINPINEVRRLAVIAKHSNLRVLSRMLELVLFIDFVLRAIIVRAVRVLGLHLFYRSAFLAGVIKVISIRSGYFIRHIFFKSYGLAVDAFHVLVRGKDRLVETVYYKFLHRLYFKSLHVVYHAVIKKILDFIIYKVLGFIIYRVLYAFYFGFLVKLYYRVIPLLNSIRLWVQLLVQYKIPHYVTMSFFKTYGLLYDACTFSYRFTKLVLLYPIFKIYWFCKFQYEKRLKRFLL